MDPAGHPSGPNGGLTAKERQKWVGCRHPPCPVPAGGLAAPTHKRPIAKILTAPPSLLPPAIARCALDARQRFSAPRVPEPERRPVMPTQQRGDRQHLRPQSGTGSGASSRSEEAGRGAQGQAGAHIRDELAIETGQSSRRRRQPVGPAPCAPSADEFRRGYSANRHSGHANWLSWPLELLAGCGP